MRPALRLNIFIFLNPALGHWCSKIEAPFLDSKHMSSNRSVSLNRANHVISSLVERRGGEGPMPLVAHWSKGHRGLHLHLREQSLSWISFHTLKSAIRLEAPLNNASRSLSSKLTPSQLTSSGSGNRNRTTLPHEGAALGPELLLIFFGSVDALSSV